MKNYIMVNTILMLAVSTLTYALSPTAEVTIVPLSIAVLGSIGIVFEYLRKLNIKDTYNVFRTARSMSGWFSLFFSLWVITICAFVFANTIGNIPNEWVSPFDWICSISIVVSMLVMHFSTDNNWWHIRKDTFGQKSKAMPHDYSFALVLIGTTVSSAFAFLSETLAWLPIAVIALWYLSDFGDDDKLPNGSLEDYFEIGRSGRDSSLLFAINYLLFFASIAIFIIGNAFISVHDDWQNIFDWTCVGLVCFSVLSMNVVATLKAKETTQ